MDIQQKLKSNLLLFGKIVCPTMFSLPSPQFHHELATLLMDDEKALINIQAPRGSAKTSIIGGLFPLYHIMFHRGPKVVLLVSKTQGHAALMLRTICDVLDYSMPFRQIFGYWGQHSARKWTNTEVVLKDGTFITCKGTGQQVRGMKFGNQRPTLIIVDDPEDESNTKTSEAMDNNLKWLLQAAVPSRDQQHGRVIVIGTPLHERCIVKTLENASHWTSRTYRYINTDASGNLYSLWEDQKPIAKLLEEKAAYEAMGKLSWFYREWQCEIVGDETQLFREEYFRYWNGYVEKKDDYNVLVITHLDKQKLENPILKPVHVFMGVDPASTIQKTADFSTIVAIAIDSERNRYILPYYRKRVTPMHLAQAIIGEFVKYNPARTKIESTGYQEMLREYVRQQSDTMGLYIAGLEISEKPRQEKSIRLESLQPYFAQRKVYLQENMQEMIDELLLYPRSRHDDLLDGLYYACKNNFVPVSDSVEGVNASKKDLLEEYEYFPTLTKNDYEQAENDWMLA